MDSARLLMAANSDTILFSLSVYYGIILKSSGIWLCPHSIEKYMKALLVPYGSPKELKSRGHSLLKLLVLLKSYNYPIPQYINNFINEIKDISTDFRYGDGPGYNIPEDFFYKYWVVTRYLRIEVNEMVGIPNYDIVGIGLSTALISEKEERFQTLRKLITDIESQVQRGNDFNIIKGWCPIQKNTASEYSYPLVP